MTYTKCLSLCLGLSSMRYHKGTVLKTTLTYNYYAWLTRQGLEPEGNSNLHTGLHLTRDGCDDYTFSNGVWDSRPFCWKNMH